MTNAVIYDMVFDTSPLATRLIVTYLLLAGLYIDLLACTLLLEAS